MPSRCDWLHKNLLEVVNATGMVAFTLARDERFSVIIQVYGTGFRYDIILDIFKAIFSLADCNTYRG